MNANRRTAAAPATASAVAAAAVILALAAAPGEAHAQQVPDWVRQVFSFYVDGQISEGELLNALEFLIDNGIIQVEAPAGPVDKGDFYVEYGPNPNSPYTADASAAAWLQGTRLLEDNSDWLNDNYRLPRDVKISGAECGGRENAFYSKSKKEIKVCYELVDAALESGYAKYPDDSKAAEDFAYNVLDGVMLHETGHALIDVYDLPVTGLEEDAVDQFSALIQSRTYGDYDPDYETGQIMMIDVAEWWDYRSLGRPLYYWGTHSLDEQRFYNIACYAYGADPEYNADMVRRDYLSADRAKGCEREYERMSSSWDRLLDGYRIE